MPRLIPRLLLKEAIVAPPGFNRRCVPPASIAIHLCIGSVYAWSIFNPALVRELGVVASASGDWSLGSVVWIFSVAIVFLGLSAAVAGRWLEEVGPRCVGVTAACLWGGGFLIGVLGVAKTMMSEIFGTTLPGIVDDAFAATYVLMISAFNMLGRIFWASMSDVMGRKNTRPWSPWPACWSSPSSPTSP